MTQREFCEFVIANVKNDEVVQFATDMVAKLDRANARKRATSTSKNDEVYAPFIEPCKALLKKSERPLLAREVAEALGISKNRVPTLMSKVSATAVDVKVKGEGTRKGYSL